MSNPLHRMKMVKLRPLNEHLINSSGVTWGIPWRLGELNRDELDQLQLEENDAHAVPLQSWAAAYWPDGSVKWSAHSAVCRGGGASYKVVKSDTVIQDQRIDVRESEETITLDTGLIICTLEKQGQSIIRSIVRDGNLICSGAKLVCLREETKVISGNHISREEPFEGCIYRVKVEQDGPVRAVVKMDGRHRGAFGSREWIPFTIRLYFYAGTDSIRMVHTMFYDGNPHEDRIKGLGLSLKVPMRGALYNRHVRVVGDTGVFSESPKTLHTSRTFGKYRELYERQTAGQWVQFDAEEDVYFQGLLDDSATWDDFKMVQESSDYYRLWKRTKPDCCWLKAGEGRRAGGLTYAGSTNGGMAVGIRHFWRKYPSGMEIRGMAQAEAELIAWLWSPDVSAMDLRHYDTDTHVESSCEGAEELRATPYGIANTNELAMWCTERTPSFGELQHMQDQVESPPLLVCEPSYYRDTGAFGIWGLPDRSTSMRQMLEDRLDGIIAFYQAEVEQRRWYGFWDYGDFMHSYDPVRHVWNYDLGGCAWQNTELAPNMWLWMMFLRSGREDIFRMAEAMTRHTSEVDVYHFGEYAGLGSRHNVVHWGCGCKEARIGMAGLHRYYYYLTADERIGDMMDEVKDADFATVQLDPMRAYFPKDEHPTHIRVGPDWAAFSSNWMTRWERYEDAAYRDKILTGIECIKKANYRLISGPTYGYDPKTGYLTPMGDDNWGRHLAISMGGPQVWFELADMVQDPEWPEMLAEFGIYYNMTQEQKDQITKGAVSTKRFEHPVLSAGIAAYGAYYKRDQETAEKVWSILLANPYAKVDLQKDAVNVKHVRELQEIDWINTNEAAQWSLNTIIALALISDYLKEKEQVYADG